MKMLAEGLSHIILLERPKASWTGIICCTHQHYHREWRSNTESSNSM